MESHPQVESRARIESTISTADTEPIVPEKEPIHISIRLIGDKGIGKASIIDRYLGKKATEEEQVSSSENTSTDTAVDQGEHGHVSLAMTSIVWSRVARPFFLLHWGFPEVSVTDWNLVRLLDILEYGIFASSGKLCIISDTLRYCI